MQKTEFIQLNFNKQDVGRHIVWREGETYNGKDKTNKGREKSGKAQKIFRKG